MIVPMKKVWVFTTEKSRSETIERLKDVGVVHVEMKEVHTEKLGDLLQQRQSLERALQVLPLEAKGEAGISVMPEDPVARGLEAAEELQTLQERLNGLMETSDRLLKERTSAEPWGNYDPDDIRMLRKKGIFLRLYSVTPEEFDTFPEEAQLIVLHRAKQLIRCVAVSRSDDEIFEPDESGLPSHSYERLTQMISENETARQELQSHIAEQAGYRALLHEAIARIDEQIEFDTVHDGMEEQEGIRYLSGYVPEPRAEQLREAAKRHQWGLLIRDPDEEEEVPTVVHNSRWIDIIKPLFQFLGILPGYWERDTSFWFLGFLTIFFAILIGDAGYGFLILAGTVYGMIRSKRATGRVADMLILVAVFAVATILWGAVTATWFGLPGVQNLAPFTYFVIPGISIFSPSSTRTVEFICFAIAVAQLCLAHIWNLLQELRGKYPLRALAQLGWFVIVLAGYNVALNLVISQTDYPILSVAWYGAGVGVLLVLFFGEQAGNFLKGIRSGLNVAKIFTTLLSSISAFGDIVSYIRLFAVGLATVAIAQSFNSMAAGMAQSGVVGIIAAVLVVLVGHTLNLLMAALAIIVHGVRLNVLEFSSHLGLEWKGTAYKPFARTPEEQGA